MDFVIDAGGTNLRAEIWDKNKLLKSLHSKSDAFGLYEWIKDIIKSHKNIRNVFIAYAGQVENGNIISSPNIDIDEYEIKKAVESMFDVSLKIENDLTCAVLAEAKRYGCQNISALYVGTGIGLGVIESGRTLGGSHNMAAEIGHIPYKKTPFRCGCGRDNCLELYASGSGLEKWIKHLNIECDNTLKSINSTNKELADAFEQALLYAVGTTVTLFNPEILVLGGSVVTSNHYLQDIIMKRITNYALPQALKDIKIVISDLEDAPIKGARLLKVYNG
jgi:glucokinase